MTDPLDLTTLLEAWSYEPGKIKVRKITGIGGRDKIQMRIDLGVLQMESKGRPDGKRPHGFESLYDYHMKRLEDHVHTHGGSDGFLLSPDECAELRAESLQYYYRYLSLFYLGDYRGVETDTGRNLDLFDFIRDYAEEEEDRYQLERYRSYVIMMNARARAYLKMKDEGPQEAIDIILEAINEIRTFLEEIGQESLIEECEEIDLLRKMAEELMRTMPYDPIQDLRERMKAAVAREDYEQAAILRDEIRRLEKHQTV